MLCSLVPAFLQQNALFYFSKVGFCWVPGFSSCYQSILKEIKSECSLAGLRLKLKLKYFGHLMRRADSLNKTLMLEKTDVRRRRGRQRMRWLDGITDSGR